VTVVAFVVERRLLKALQKQRGPAVDVEVGREGEQDLSAAV
jgi:hypothetical protein